MGLRHAIETLAEQWNDVRTHLSPEEARSLASLVEEFRRETDPKRSVSLARGIVRFLQVLLPDDHVVLLALEQPEQRLVVGDTRSLSEWLSLPHLLTGALAGSLTAEEVARGARAWLLAADAYTKVSSPDPDLIRLEREDGVPQWPAFQFDSSRTPLPIVLRINRILEAQDDPWGVADWWLGENAWLGGGIPAQLISQVDDEVLVDAATGERAEV